MTPIYFNMANLKMIPFGTFNDNEMLYEYFADRYKLPESLKAEISARSAAGFYTDNAASI